MHGVLHIGRVPDETGGFRAQMAVLVKPNGLLGTAYMAAIRPFRHVFVYPAIMREMGRTWRAVTTVHLIAVRDPDEGEELRDPQGELAVRLHQRDLLR
jgi:hypothetical protein